MIKKIKIQKTDKCLNCGTALNDEFHYCPACGQKNDSSQMSFHRLVGEFFKNYFSLDSRFGRSIKPFFLKPGQLTQEFMAGKRMTYANPIRLYLVISLIHFFVFSLRPTSVEEGDSFIDQGSNATLDENTFLRIHEDSVSLDSDSIVVDSTKWHPSQAQLATILDMAQDESNSFAEIAEVVKLDEMTGLQHHLTSQVIKLQKSDPQTLRTYMFKNIPILMFILLPIYALLLKIFFRKRLYIQHLIHSLHLHSFLFLMLTIMWLVVIFAGTTPPGSTVITFMLLALYVILSFRKNYDNSWGKTLLLVFSTGSAYFIILTFGILVEIVISLLLF